MAKETYQIRESGYDEVQAFGYAFSFLNDGKIPDPDDFCISNNFNDLESSFPSDTIKVATYVNKKYSTKKIYFYVCSFTESTDFNNLESSLPPDTIKVATFLYKEYSTKKIYFYVCSFPEPLAHYSYSLFSIMWSRDSLWECHYRHTECIKFILQRS